METIPTQARPGLAERIRTAGLHAWLVPALAFVAVYLWRPFTLGFYSDDWSSLAEATRHGGPFSLTRLEWLQGKLAYSRPLQVLEQFVFTSLLGNSTFAWQLLMAVLVAVSCVMLRRFLLALGVRDIVATIGSGFWLVLPWSLGYTAWPVASCILLSVIFFLAGSVSLLRLRLWSSLAWFAASMLSYEAFYLQFAVVLVILLASRETRRWALTRALGPLLALQLAIVLGNRWAAAARPDLAKNYDGRWPQHLLQWLWRLPVTLSHAISGPHILALGLVLGCGLFALGCAFFVRERRRQVALAASVLGLLLACVVVALAGYKPGAIGTPTRTMVAINIWFVMFVALAWPGSIRRAWLRLAVTGAVSLVFVALVLSSIARTHNWQQWYVAEQDVVAAAPVDEIARLDPGAAVLVTGIPYAGGLYAFDNRWGLTGAIANRQPATRTPDNGFRQFTEVLPGEQLVWDGQVLYKNGLLDLKANELWLWRWPAQTLERVTDLDQALRAPTPGGG